MKLFWALIFILSCVISNAQSSDTALRNKQIQYETLMRQRNNQRTAGIVLWIAGDIVGTIGAVYSIASLGDNNTAGAVVIAGVGMVGTGVGLLISSWIKKRKAKALLRTGISRIEFNTKNYVAKYSVGISIAL